MTDHTANEFNRAKSRMLGDFNKAISDAAELRDAAAEAAGEGIAAARVEIEEKPGSAGAGPAVATPAAAGTLIGFPAARP